MYWLSVDPGNKAGVAMWDGDYCKRVITIRPRGKQGYWVRDFNGEVNKEKCYGKIDAWRPLIKGVHAIVIERGAGFRPNVINAQAAYRGYLQAICDIEIVKYRELNVSEWRRVIKEARGISWPAQSEAQKELAKKLVLEKYNRDCTEDEADAVLIGEAALRLKLIDF